MYALVTVLLPMDIFTLIIQVCFNNLHQTVLNQTAIWLSAVLKRIQNTFFVFVLSVMKQTESM